MGDEAEVVQCPFKDMINHNDGCIKNVQSGKKKKKKKKKTLLKQNLLSLHLSTFELE